MKRKLLFSFSSMFIGLIFATQAMAVDVSQVVNNMLGPLSAFTDSFYKICYALGIILVIGSGVQYRMYRKNPVQVRFSNVIFLLIVGIIVFCLPFIVNLSSSARVIDKSIARQQASAPQTVPNQPAMPSSQPQDNNWYSNPQQPSS